jgi:hypothetical protein
LIDELTMRMTAAYRQSKLPRYIFFGFHRCSCGAHSDNKDHFLPDGTKTNSLCIHYLAYHREQVPEADLLLVSQLACGVESPTSFELHGPVFPVREGDPPPIIAERRERFEKQRGG